MSPSAEVWTQIVEAYRDANWYECVRTIRPVVEEEPHDLGARFLLAELYTRLENRGLALLQYERLLPLAVGRGDFYAALAAQRRLDELHPTSRQHTQRYAAMQQWFRSLAARGEMRADSDLGLAPGMFFDMEPSVFSRIAERAKLRLLDPAPTDLTAAFGERWVVVFGRVLVPSPGSPTVALAGATLDDGGPGPMTLHVEPETPALCVGLDLALPAHETPAAPATPSAASGAGANPLDAERHAA